MTHHQSPLFELVQPPTRAITALSPASSPDDDRTPSSPQWHPTTTALDNHPSTPIDETAPPTPMDEHGRLMASLPPVDTGKDAWLFIVACCVLEMMVWGIPAAFGVFQDYYAAHAPFADSPNVAVVGSLSSGINYLTTPLSMGLMRLFPRQARWASHVGLATMCLALVFASLATTVPQLIATQGIMFALGGSVCYSPCIMYLDQWFVRRRGFAYGIIMSGTGMAGVVVPLLTERLLSRYGFEITMRAMAAIVLGTSAPLMYFIKPRLPPSAATHSKPWRLGFLFTRSFMIYELANLFQAMGYFLPSIYLPIYARAVLGASSVASALTVLLLNVASVFGSVAMGGLMDRVSATTGLMLSTVGGGASTFLLWGLATNLAVLYVFCFVYGLLAGSFTSAWPGIMHEMTKPRTEEEEERTTPNGSSANGATAAAASADPGMVFAFLCVARGVGNIASGPLSGALIESDSWEGQAGWGYGSGYGSLIVFTGVTAMAGAVSFLWKRIGRL